jgi:diamine N-acetyltransferase
MAITVRKAQPEDAAIIALLGRLTFRETFSALFVGREDELRGYLDLTFSVPKIASSIAKPQNHYWLALLDELPVGYAKHKHPSATVLIDDAAPAQLQKIYVLHDFISHRIGHALLNAVMQEAVAAQIRLMWLTVLDSNERAIRFYERHGWSSVGKAAFAIGTQDFSYLVMQTTVIAD